MAITADSSEDACRPILAGGSARLDRPSGLPAISICFYVYTLAPGESRWLAPRRVVYHRLQSIRYAAINNQIQRWLSPFGLQAP
jgi:hypothetical protein